MKDLQLQDGYKISSKGIKHNGQLLSDVIDLKTTTGAETPTNEYIDGRRVYYLKKLLGYCPNNQYTIYYTGLNSNYGIVRYSLFATAGNQVLNIPFTSLNMAEHIYGYINNANEVPIVSDWNSSPWMLWIEIYYTKN